MEPNLIVVSLTVVSPLSQSLCTVASSASCRPTAASLSPVKYFRPPVSSDTALRPGSAA